MNKPIMMALGMMAALFTALGIGSIPDAFAQYVGGGGEGAPLTQQQLDKCAQYGISPCTETGILAKERLLNAQDNPSTGSGTPYFQGLETVAVIGALAAIFGGVAAAFFIKGRGSKPVTT